ncbi:MAG: S9 family peptidase [Rhodospirillales bacterium]|nr:S9 family peptidase [Rhodospirillales bacterium]
MPAPDPKPPVAPQKPVTATLHGIARSDDYAWLKDPDWQCVMREPEALDPDIRAYLEAENAYTDAVLAPHKALRETLVSEMRGRMKEDDSSVPAPDGDWAYYRRYVEGGEHPLYCRAPRADESAEVLLLDGNREAESQAYFRIGDCEHSHDHRRLAYTLDLNGSERYRLYVRDIASGDVIDGPIEDAYGDVIWAADGETVFYTVLDENHRPYRVRRHRVGSAAEADPVVYEESDPGFFVNLGESENRRFVMISAHDHTTSEVHLIESAAPEGAPRLIAARERGIEYDVALRGDSLYILTNADDAVDFKIMTAPLEAPERAAWRDWLPHEAGTYVRAQLLFAGHHVRLERVGGLPRIVITDLETGAAHTIAFEEEAYDLSLLPGYEFETETLRFVYSSMTTPQQTFDYDMRTRARTLRKTQEVPSGHDPADYVTRRLNAVSHDGAEVPVSLLHRRSTPLDGTAPLLLYGYGAYGHAIPAAFSTNRLSLVDRGFVYAIAHIRGGSDCGYGWYLDGKLAKKTNTFADFIVAAEHLIAERYTAKGRIAAHGGSAGGMLMGAVANMRPDLFASIVAEVPFVDVLNTMCDEGLPLTPPEWPEWGNPIEHEDAYRTIAAYAPYENVTAGAYPAIFATAGLTDPRVTYWEPAKWVAKLRRLKTDDNPLLLHTNMEAGHGGASGRFRRLREVAMAYAFVLAIAGRA